jgi:hypothetical protein
MEAFYAEKAAVKAVKKADCEERRAKSAARKKERKEKAARKAVRKKEEKKNGAGPSTIVVSLFLLLRLDVHSGVVDDSVV